ncbi:unnamed protein product [Peronospora farinosa]|uniref:Uncharacterized protein n=1 Tax=Peronospora farinosa TaxID=134698 RepID=A0ABN8BV18_9STRA|nr:unnamed protein product [Peronospora farinosa]
MLGDLLERMNRMESSQAGKAEQQRKDSVESSIFSSFLETRASINLQALKRTPPYKRSPNLLPVTYFGAQRPAYAGDDIVDAPTQVNDNF